MRDEETKGNLGQAPAGSLLSFPKDLPAEDPDYLDFIRKQPCLICRRPFSEAHHQQEEGKGTMGGKCSDYRALPLCGGIDGHHTGNGTKAQPGSYHTIGRELFWRYGIDVEHEITILNGEYFFA